MWFMHAMLASILWGLSYSLCEKILQHISTFTLLSIEMFIGSIVFFILAYSHALPAELSIIAHHKTLWVYIVVEIIVFCLASYYICQSIHEYNGLVAAIIETIYPIFTFIFTWLLFNQNPLNVPIIVGGVFIFIGVSVISQS